VSIDPDAFRPLPIADQRVSAARAEAEALLAEANRMHGEASSKAQRLVADAHAEAGRIRAAAHAETEQRKKRDDNLDTWAARGIIAGAVGLTASGEYSLARMAGFDQTVAWLLPFVIDVYVIQAFRRHRDIGQAIALTVAANVTYHLAAVGLFGVTAKREPTWWLIALVASVASLILWRIHLMVRPPKPAKERTAGRQEERQEAPVAPPTPEPAPAPTGDSTTAKTAANNDRQETTAGGVNNRQNEAAKKAAPVAKKTTSPGRQKPAKTTAKKAASTRRSMDEWVALTEPIFHAEFARLRRNPTATEFATAIANAGHGRPSDSTAKNIRTEILDRAELPSLDGTE
jgi:hypothetical protein